MRTVFALPFFIVGVPLCFPAGFAAHGGGPHTKLDWAISYALMVPFYIGWPFMWLGLKIQGG